MPEEFDFSELRKYLQGQMDMGEEDLLLDEPWTLTRKKSAVPAGAPRPANPMPQMRPANPAPFPQHSAPANPAPIPQQSPFPSNPAPFANPAQSAFAAQSAFQQPAFGAPVQPAPAPRPAPAPKLDAGLTIAPRAVKKTTAAYELADSIGAFYDALKTDALYARAANVVRYEGPEHPRLLILLAAPKSGEPAPFSSLRLARCLCVCSEASVTPRNPLASRISTRMLREHYLRSCLLRSVEC